MATTAKQQTSTVRGSATSPSSAPSPKAKSPSPLLGSPSSPLSGNLSTHKQTGNFLENEEDIASIAKQISDHAEAIYQTWKARGLAPTEILNCHTGTSDAFGKALTPPSRHSLSSPVAEFLAQAPDMSNNNLEKLVSSFVSEDKARQQAARRHSGSAASILTSGTIKDALRKFENSTAPSAYVKPNFLIRNSPNTNSKANNVAGGYQKNLSQNQVQSQSQSQLQSPTPSQIQSQSDGQMIMNNRKTTINTSPTSANNLSKSVPDVLMDTINQTSKQMPRDNIINSSSKVGAQKGSSMSVSTSVLSSSPSASLSSSMSVSSPLSSSSKSPTGKLILSSASSSSPSSLSPSSYNSPIITSSQSSPNTNTMNTSSNISISTLSTTSSNIKKPQTPAKPANLINHVPSWPLKSRMALGMSTSTGGADTIDNNGSSMGSVSNSLKNGIKNDDDTVISTSTVTLTNKTTGVKSGESCKTSADLLDEVSREEERLINALKTGMVINKSDNKLPEVITSTLNDSRNDRLNNKNWHKSDTSSATTKSSTMATAKNSSSSVTSSPLISSAGGIRSNSLISSKSSALSSISSPLSSNSTSLLSACSSAPHSNSTTLGTTKTPIVWNNDLQSMQTSSPMTSSNSILNSTTDITSTGGSASGAASTIDIISNQQQSKTAAGSLLNSSVMPISTTMAIGTATTTTGPTSTETGTPTIAPSSATATATTIQPLLSPFANQDAGISGNLALAPNKMKLRPKNDAAVPHPEAKMNSNNHINNHVNSRTNIINNPVRPFLTRGSVAERVLMFEKCPDVKAPLRNINREPPKASTKPLSKPSHQSHTTLQRHIRSSTKNVYIPRFYFPHGKPQTTITAETTLQRLVSAFDSFPSNQVTKEDFHHILKICSIPFYWRMPLMACTQNASSGLVDGYRFIEFWKAMGVYCHDPTSRFVYILSRGQRSRPYIVHEDLASLVQDVVDTHPGLAFLKEAAEFHSRYVHTVIARIFYSVNRSWSGKITVPELRRSNLLQVIQLLEEEEDINQIMAFFSYEHFYVIYCKFWELDRDHDLFIDQNDLARHNDHALSTRIIERIFSGCVTRGGKARIMGPNGPKMSYTDFVWFLLSEEDKTNITAIEYWFRCMDLDGDGIISMYELEYFYEEQQQRMESIGIETLPFEDCLCQMLDMIKPVKAGCITLGDLKRCRMTPIFFDTFFNLEKYLEHEQRDPFATQRDNDDMTDWDRYAAQEYELLVAEEGGDTQGSYDEDEDYESNIDILESQLDDMSNIINEW